MNGSSTADMKSEKRIYRTLPDASRFSIAGKEGKPDSVFCLPLLLKDGSVKNDWRREMFGVHY
jgi:hypothetical protein